MCIRDSSSLNYSSTDDIGGFQIEHDGCINGASGGDAAENGFTISTSGSVVLAFSFTGSVVPAGEGTLVELDGDNEITSGCLTNFIFSDPSGAGLEWEFIEDSSDDGGDVQASCSGDEQVCLSLDGNNLDYTSTDDIGGFQFSHNGCVEGATGGDAAANGFTISASGSVVLAFSFTGSVVPSGDGTLVELEGDINQECLSGFIFSDIDGAPLSVEFAEVTSDDGGDDGGSEASCPEGTEVCLNLDGADLTYLSTANIAGFQFSHDGCVEGAAGGDAAANGFTISASGSTVLAFSFTGSVVPAGEGTLVELTGDISESCLSGFIFSNASGDPLSVSFPVFEVLGCTDDEACNYDDLSLIHI